jgi:exosome complex component RRP40
VYARVAACSKYMEPELTCEAGPGMPKKDWMTGQSVYGELTGGTVVHVSLTLARRLLSPACTVLTALGTSIPFEVAIGLNGWVWVQAGSPLHTIIVSNVLLRAEHMTDAECEQLVRKLVATAGGGAGGSK